MSPKPSRRELVGVCIRVCPGSRNKHGPGCHAITKWGPSTGDRDSTAKPSACHPGGIPERRAPLAHHCYCRLGQPSPAPTHRNISPTSATTFLPRSLGAAPSPAPGLTLMAEPRDRAGPLGQSRQECPPLGPEPAGRGAGLRAGLWRTEAPISLPASC